MKDETKIIQMGESIYNMLDSYIDSRKAMDELMPGTRDNQYNYTITIGDSRRIGFNWAITKIMNKREDVIMLAYSRSQMCHLNKELKNKNVIMYDRIQGIDFENKIVIIDCADAIEFNFDLNDFYKTKKPLCIIMNKINTVKMPVSNSQKIDLINILLGLVDLSISKNDDLKLVTYKNKGKVQVRIDYDDLK